MRTISLFFSLLLSLTAFGQPSPINRRAFALAGLSEPRFKPDEFSWVFSDMPTNIVVTNWVERHYASAFTNALPNTTCPTNNALGVHFTRTLSQTLTNAAHVFGTTSTHFVILRREVAGAFQAILEKNGGGTLEWIWITDHWELDLSGAHKAVDGDPGGTANFFDMAMVTDGGANTLVGYTNGVPYATNTATSLSGPFAIMGGLPSEYFGGWIKEYNGRTNTAETAVQIAARHTAATNTYGYTP